MAGNVDVGVKFGADASGLDDKCNKSGEQRSGFGGKTERQNIVCVLTTRFASVEP